MVNYPISDMLIRIKNAQAVGNENVSVPFSNMKSRIAQILCEGGFVAAVERRKKKGKKAELEYLSLTLKYGEENRPAISGFKIISKPSRHMYTGAKEIKPVRSGYGVGIISTSKGIMNSKEAKKQNLGGEMLFEVW